MDEIRCPMCSTTNEPEAEICRACGARLRPLQAEGAPGSGAKGELPPAPDWLDRIRAELPEEVGGGDKEEPASPDWLGRMRQATTSSEEGPPPGEMPDWLSEFTAERTSPPSEPPKPATPPVPSEPPPAVKAETPDWLARIRDREAKAREAAPEKPEESDWLARFREEAIPAAPSPSGQSSTPEPPVPAPPVFPPAVSTAQTPVVPPRPATAQPAAPALRDAPRLDTPRPEAPMPPSAPPPEPPAVRQPEKQPGEELPKVPALILDDGEARPGAKGDVEFDSIQLPEWLSELKSAVPEPDQPAPGQKAGDLAPATIPAWLEAMRPIDSFRSVVEIEPEEEQSIEAAGPLAGLRGVLLAEPVVAIPRSAPSAGGQVDVTERHYAQAELLQRILAEEAQEVPHAAPKKRRLSLTSGVVSAVLLLAAALPPILGTPTFPVPSTAQWPPELSPFIEKVNALPSGQPALVVFDYEPGYAGEMEAVAGPVIDHLMRQAVPLVSLSTRPTGPSLAERLLSRYSGLHSTPAGTAYVHLGYLPGGPTAVQAFVAAPRAAGLSGFLAPESAAAGGPWASPILASVNHLSDFGAIVLLSAGAESARAWVEQAAPARGETPLLLVVSAGVEPVMRPYYEATRPQVAGLLSGLPVALAYEQANGRQGDALSRWNSFGSSALAAEILLGIGAALAGARWVVGRRRPA